MLTKAYLLVTFSQECTSSQTVQWELLSRYSSYCKIDIGGFLYPFVLYSRKGLQHTHVNIAKTTRSTYLIIRHWPCSRQQYTSFCCTYKSCKKNFHSKTGLYVGHGRKEEVRLFDNVYGSSFRCLRIKALSK